MTKNRSINDQIVELLKPKEIQDPEADGDELTLAKVSEFDEGIEENERKLSDFRKRNVTDVTKTDKKYKGEVVSRAELEDEFESSEDDNLEEEYATDTEDEEELDEEEEEEDDNDDEDENTESEDSDARQETFESQKTQILRPEAQSEKVRQGKAVKIQLQLWEKLLEMRIKSQKLLTLANSLPFGDTYQRLNQDEKFMEAISSTTDTLFTLLNKHRTLQSTLVEEFPESKDILKSSRKRKLPESDSLDAKRVHIDLLWQDLDTFTRYYKPFRDSVLQKWHDRTKIATNVKSLKSMESQSVLQKIDNVLLNHNELIRKTQIYHGGYEIVGHPIERKSDESSTSDDNTTSDIPVKKDSNVYVPEIYDDSDFYHQLLRELIEFKTSTSSNPQELEQKYQELHQLRSKMKKSVDTRASKGRKIRYVVHNKLVNFMAPVPDDAWTDEAKTELYNSLFDKLLQQSNE